VKEVEVELVLKARSKTEGWARMGPMMGQRAKREGNGKLE
jgi:hypothetical protein